MSALALLGLAEQAVVRVAAQLGPATAVQIAAAPPSTETQAWLAKNGVSRVIHIWDSALEAALEASLERELIYASVLNSLLRQVEATTLVVGDGKHAWLGPALAEDLDLAHVTGVLDAVPVGPALGEKGDVLVQRLGLQGVQRLRGPARCVLAVLPFGPLPQLALPAVAPSPRAATPSLERWDLDKLGLHPEDLPRSLLKLLQPEKHSVFPGRTFDSIEELVDRLRQDGLAPPESLQAGAELDAVQPADDLVIDG
jgi:hypothetical protein